MAFVIEVTAGGGVPIGIYRGRFVRIEHFESDNGFGPGYKWVWKIIEGAHDGAEACRITSQKMGPEANTPRFLKMIYGRELKPGERPDVEQQYGTSGTLVVEDAPNGGGTRVGSFMRDADAPASVPASADAPVVF